MLFSSSPRASDRKKGVRSCQLAGKPEKVSVLYSGHYSSGYFRKQ